MDKQYKVTKITDEANRGDYRIKNVVNGTIVTYEDGIELSFTSYEEAFDKADELNRR